MESKLPFGIQKIMSILCFLLLAFKKMRRFKCLIWYISKCYTRSISSWLKCSNAVYSSDAIQKHSFKQSKCHLCVHGYSLYMRLNFTFTNGPYLHYKQEQQSVKLLIHGDQSWIFFIRQFQLYFIFIVSHISIGFSLNVSPPSSSYR